MIPRALVLLIPALLPATLVRIEVSERSPILDGRQFGRTGPISGLSGKLISQSIRPAPRIVMW